MTAAAPSPVAVTSDAGGARARTEQPLVLAAALVGAYVALAAWAREFAVTEDGTLSVWYPPPGLVLVVLHLRGVRYWPAALLAEIAVSLWVYDVAADFGTFRMVVNAVGVTGAYAIGAAVLREAPVRPGLGRRYDLAWFILATFLIAAPVAALVGVGVQWWAGFELDGGFARAVVTWWVGDAVGLLVLAPVGYALARTAGSGFVWFKRVIPRLGAFDVCEALAVVLMPVAVFVILDDPYRALYLVILPVGIVAIRHGSGPGAFAVLGSVLVSTIAANSSDGGTIGRTDLQLLLLVVGITGNAFGLLEQLRRQASARARELAAVLEATPDIVVIVDEEDGLQWVNPAGRRLGIGDHAGDDLAEYLEGALEGGAASLARERGNWQGTLQIDGEDGNVHLSQMVVALPDDHGTRVAIIARDVSDLRELSDQLARAAFTDELTGLPNRARLFERLDFALRQHMSFRQHGLVLVDIDRFAAINDHRGHDVGDAVLKGVAQRLDSVIRSGELLARVGDDRFAVLVEDVADQFAVVAVAERLRAAAGGGWITDMAAGNAGLADDGASSALSVSAGVVLGSPGDDPDVLLRRADLALQRAKQAGGAATTPYDQTLSDHLSEQIRIEGLLRAALAGDGWALRFQPVVELASGRPVGCEALLEPVAPPLAVVRVAEELGLIGELGDHVLASALAEAVRWRARLPGFVVGVNVSALQLDDPGWPGRVTAALERSGLPGNALVLEITETAFSDDDLRASEAVAALRSHGVQVSIDDFGTGFSSLGRLRSLPADELKLDRTFVADLGVRPGAEAIVAAVVALGDALGLGVVAEGIELDSQRASLVELGCLLGQGWLFAKPMGAAQLDRWLDDAVGRSAEGGT